MKYLLDTHVFIWLDNEPDKLSSKVATLCADPDNDLYLSIVNVWEMQIKLVLGKLTLPSPLPDLVNNQIKSNQVTLLPLELSHVFELSSLPKHHKDPFDRLLIAQALNEQHIILSDDTHVSRYPVPIVW